MILLCNLPAGKIFEKAFNGHQFLIFAGLHDTATVEAVDTVCLADGAETGFVEYLYKYSLPILLPLFVLIWCFFFRS